MKQNKTIIRKQKWNVIDRFLSYWRTRFIDKYIGADSIVADIGCGQEGSFLLSIAHKIKRGYGYDFNLKEESSKGNITLLNTDFLDDSKQYNIVLLIATLEHLPYPQEVHILLTEVYSRLQSGGYFILTTPDKRSQGLLEFLSYKMHLLNEEEIRDHKHYFDKGELENLMVLHGFREISHKYFQLGLNNLVICRK